MTNSDHNEPCATDVQKQTFSEWTTAELDNVKEKSTLEGAAINLELTDNQNSGQPSSNDSSLTIRQYLIMLSLGYGYFCLGSSYSLLAPFFPKEAEMKGVSPSQYGLIFSSYEVVAFLLCPVFGKMMPWLLPKFFIIMGIFVAGYSFTLFGLLYWSPPGKTFVALGLVIRAVSGCGGAAFFTGGFTCVAISLPNAVSRAIATLEMALGLGLIAGPALGGVLYELGGFPLPFIFTGTMTLLGVIPMVLIVPEKCTINTEKKGSSAIKCLSNPRFFLDVSVNVVCCTLAGFNDATLEHHIREFATLSASQIGGIFLLCGLFYSLSTQGWGYICEKIENTHVVCIFSLIISVISFSLCGPLYGLPIAPNVKLVIVAQILLGTALGGQVVGSFTDGIRAMEKSDMPQGVGLYALISSIYASAFSFGASIGPTLGGVMVDYVGYREGMVFIVAIQVLLIIVMVIHNRSSNCTQSTKL